MSDTWHSGSSLESVSRRWMLRAVTALSSAGAFATVAGGVRPTEAAVRPRPGPGTGRGRAVVIVGAGLAGLTAAHVLADAGYKVMVLEADNRYGGRSLTARPSQTGYRDWWFGRYNPQRLFERMYVSEYRESGRSPDPARQVCQFADDRWDGPDSGHDPVDLFLNAGPGRIPSNHVALIDLCKEIKVAMEPYIFLSQSNLLQTHEFANGRPIPFGQVTYSLMGQLAAMMARVVLDGHALGQVSNSKKAEMLTLLQQFGDLNQDYRFSGSQRLGYTHLPGGWRDPGRVRPTVPFDDILGSGFVGGGNPELTPGSFLFNGDNVLWQPTLMQPAGGMDRIWQQLLLQPVPADALFREADGGPADSVFEARDSANGGEIRRYVGDLVQLDRQVTRIFDQNRDKVHVTYRDRQPGPPASRTVTADFCLSTMAPGLLASVAADLPDAMRSALRNVKQTPAIKVGWQGKTRFWETETQIYGGISWTDDLIGQVWYPSENFTAHTGVLTGAYNRGPLAVTFGEFSQEQRIAAALRGGEKLHPGFQDKVYRHKGLTVAWQYMPFQEGGWPSDTATLQPEVYQRITTLPQGRLSMAGDAWSYLPGWQEGAVTAAYAAVRAIMAG